MCANVVGGGRLVIFSRLRNKAESCFTLKNENGDNASVENYRSEVAFNKRLFYGFLV